MSSLENNPPTVKDGLMILAMLAFIGVAVYLVEEEKPDPIRNPAPPDTLRIQIDRPTIIIIEP